MGSLVSFSGVDSSGKSTQINKLIEYYSENNSSIIVKWSRGGYTPGINLLKSLARRFSRNAIPAQGHSSERTAAFKNPVVTRLWLFISILDLIIYYGIWYRILSLKYIVIADRYIWDTYIDFKMMFPLSDFEDLLIWRTLVLIAKKPNHSIILTLDSEESLRRSLAKNEPFMENITLRKKRINFYHNLILDNYWDKVIVGSRSINSIFDEIKVILSEN